MQILVYILNAVLENSGKRNMYCCVLKHSIVLY